MTEMEKFAAQGRAYTELKKARADIATLNVSLLEHGRALGEVAGLLSRFVADPASVNPSVCISLCDHLKASIRKLPTADTIAALVDELLDQTTRVKELQEQVDRF